jgi:tetratricopeptide (TPR) repeat protein
MEPRVFVVMPFGVKEVQPATPASDDNPARPALEVDFDDVYEHLIGPALMKAGCVPFRADQESGAGDIRTDMFFELVTADVVLADISILNANVFYELGVRHGVAPRGVFMIHAGWSRRPFDVAPDRTFDYDGKLFTPSQDRNDDWCQRLGVEVEQLAAKLKNALAVDEQGSGSPVYKELVGLKPVDWSAIQTAKAKYFGGVLDDWKQRVRIARKNGYPGDILTLAGDAPTRFHHQKLLLEAARGLIDLHRFNMAKSVLDEVLDLEPTNLDAQCQLGLVLGRLGMMVEAEEHITRVTQKWAGDPEAQGILGRFYKDMWRECWETLPELPERQQKAVDRWNFAVQAVRSYNRAHRYKLESYYNGINVISLIKLLNHLGQVLNEEVPDTGVKNLNELVAVVRVAASNSLEHARQEDSLEAKTEVVWAAATLGELELLVGKVAKARNFYKEAANTSGVTYFQLKSIQSQLCLFDLLGFQTAATAEVMEILQSRLDQVAKPDQQFRKVVVSSGHMIDAPDRFEPRFPPSKEGIVREQLAEKLNSWEIGPGDLAMCGGACGGDILFAELCADRGAHVKLFIALPEGEFLKKSVRLAGSNWDERYFALRNRHPQVETCFQYERLGAPPGGTSEFARNNLWIINTARVEAKPGKQFAVLVWDEKSTGDGPGGTSHFAAEVEKLGQLEIINPTKL